MGLTVTALQLRVIAAARAPRVDEIANAFNMSASKFGLDQPLRAAHFFAQIAHESGGFRFVREIWGPTPAQLGYEGRRDLGNLQPRDGKGFLGRGLIQITGRANARAFTKWAQGQFPGAPDFETTPIVMEGFPWALLGCFWYWDTRDLNALADKDDLVAVTKKINGGLNGLDDRRLKLALARKAFASGFAPVPLGVPTRDAAGRKTLRRGAKGAEVNNLQQKIGIVINGKFGPITELAVINFQRSHDLLPDGIVGPATWYALEREA